MNIAILGYGKMGKTIEKIAQARGHKIALIKNKTPEIEELKTIDVAIDFSQPQAALSNILRCIESGTAIVSGTTGWLDHYDQAVLFCNNKEGSFIYSSNFSIGVNLFFKLNRILAEMMQPYEDYKPEIEEIHHLQKQDAPSGTAITLAQGIIENSTFDTWFLKNGNESVEAIPILVKRIGNIPGIHTVSYDSPIDEISITHTAHSREGFALGAVIAAEWIKDKKGIFTMQDVLNLNKV